ncbi:serine/threonine-protein kinase [Saccharopolyspora rosea]|uniref:non-specific serine/threonine protein kinase n=1 Tax=Saccharopolyspora rosea TaxID=524884 RepID=A0ABW3FJT6_9PSEU|nr:serine/threonine-protein kinase [Saccharopolyspora rosea]
MSTESNDTVAGAGRLIADRYRLENKLGSGAMGTVWAGMDELLRRPVAVKEVRLPPGMPDEEAAEIRERALREARAIAVLSHPNVVTLYDVAREEGEPFVVMELVPSQALAAILAEHGALDDRQLAVVADGVAAALDAAHQAGIVHRDVKPGNVLIADDGRIKLSDFGISRNRAEHTITSTGILLGTPSFIAPEIAAGEPVTAKADLWGLGATLFAASEGRPPYDVGDDPVATVTEVVHGPVPVCRRTGPIADVIAGLMVKDPAQRMSLTEVRRRIQHMLPEPGSRPFSMLLDPEAPTLRVRRPEPQNPTRQDQPEPAAAPLAADPGAPPFELRDPPPAPPQRRRRSPLAVVALALGALLVFSAALAGGFAATRVAAGRSPLPPERTGTASAAPTTRLDTRTDAANHTGDSGSGRFSIPVPAGWTVYHSERSDLTNSKTVSFVSPDGHRELAVERFGGYFGDGYSVADYVRALPKLAAGSKGAFTLRGQSQQGQDQQVSYSTVESALVGSGASLSRTTTARLVRHDNDLWVVRVTVPTQDAARSAKLLNTVFPGFAPAS